MITRQPGPLPRTERTAEYCYSHALQVASRVPAPVHAHGSRCKTDCGDVFAKIRMRTALRSGPDVRAPV